MPVLARTTSRLLHASLLLVMLLVLSWSPPSMADAGPSRPDELFDEEEDDDYPEDEDEKQQPYKPRTGSYRFHHRTVIIPHDEKKYRGGEDAASTTDEMLVVADGVGGWANRGVNPGLYSRRLTTTITERFEKLEGDHRQHVNLTELVHESNYAAASEHLGSATCTVVRLMDADTLETLNVGDSGYSIHRKYNRAKKGEDIWLKVAYASVPGQKGFNYPYQLGGKHGDEVYGEGVADGPRRHQLHPKDIVVLASDGVLDNINPRDYHRCLQRYQYRSDKVSDDLRAYVEEHLPYLGDGDLVSKGAAADCIARTAYAFGKNETHVGPFALSARRYGKRYVGGKHDDITVTVAQVVKDKTAGGAVHFLGDAHTSESIFVYTNQHGPIAPAGDLPGLEELLRATRVLAAEAADADAAAVAGEPEL